MRNPHNKQQYYSITSPKRQVLGLAKCSSGEGLLVLHFALLPVVKLKNI